MTQWYNLNMDENENEQKVPRFVDLIEYRRTTTAGARTKLDEQKIEFASTLIEKGCTVPDAAYLIGISERTWYRWKARGDELIRYVEECEKNGAVPALREDDELYIEFADRISIALPFRKLRLRGVIEAAANDGRNWTAAAWMLERQYPDEYSRKVQIEHNLDNKLIQLIQTGEVTYDLLLEEMSAEEAGRLFNAARVEIPERATGEQDS